MPAPAKPPPDYSLAPPEATGIELVDGTPVFRGTRVPLDVVTASLDNGIPFERVQASYGFLTPALSEAASAYLLAHPALGRRSIAEVHPDWTIVEKRVVRLPLARQDADARDVILGPRQAIAGQFVLDDELDRALGVGELPVSQRQGGLLPGIDPVSNKSFLDAAERSLDENSDALDSSNSYVDENGLPLDRGD